MKEMVGGCCVCSDERGWPDNPLVYCDGNGCTVAVHQACYGIVTVPTGPWFCRKCECPEAKGKVKCELCPSKSGALKRTDTNGWAHVVCALYIPEVRFGNVTSMEPIVLRLIPTERYNKTCYICQDLGKAHRATVGACMQCNKSGCKQQFHVTCAQSLGLLCEEAGNYLDNVKYCGYCQHHYGKLPGRKTSAQASGVVSGKNTPNASKTPTNTNQSMDKKKPSPARRGSLAGDASGSGSKTSTPAPSPQHNIVETPQIQSGKASGSSTPVASKVLPPSGSPGTIKTTEAVGVINSVASGAVTSVATITAVPSSTISTPIVQSQTPKHTQFQESVITNAECMETKQTKKRKAMAAASTSNTPIDLAAKTPPAGTSEHNNHSSSWEGGHPSSMEISLEGAEKIIKKAKTDSTEAITLTSHFPGMSPIPPPPPPPPLPPPPAHSPASHRSPRHLPSPMPGPSGLNPVSAIRSPSQHQMGLPSEIPGSSQHIFHQPHKQAAMEPNITGHSPHAILSRSTWSGLNISYEMQQDPNKPSVSRIASTSKDIGMMTGSMAPIQPAAIRNKKRAAMASSVVSMANTSGPSAIHSERPLKPKIESKIGVSCTAPHMLGNELNPESGAAARLQEQLSAELAAHAAGSAGSDPLVPPPLINKAASGLGNSSSRGSSSAQSLDQLLERQWEQGSQFLMEQAQHFDIASLLSCLHQLRTENVRLEEHVGNLLQRRDHLLAVNARLAIPLTTVMVGPPEPPRCMRENGTQVRPPPPPPRAPETITSERAHQLLMREVQQKPS